MNHLNNVYSPDGTLQSRTHTFRKLITTIKVNSKGDTIVSTANRSVTEGNYYYGNFEKSNGKLRLNTSAGYYDMETGEHYQYLRNRQGSVMAVVNSRGETVQRTGLYPSGTPYILPCDYQAEGTNDMTPKTDHLHIGNHWMSQSGLNFYDNTARMHDPILCDMKSGDPKFFDYPSMNHFAFCGANPANIIDPIGEKNYYFSIWGYLEEVVSNDDADIIYINGNSLTLKKGTVGSIYERTPNVGGDYCTVDIIHLNGNDVDKIYEFIVRNTECEWGVVQAEKNNNKYNFLTTTHMAGSEAGLAYVETNAIKDDYNVISDTHNHPSGNSEPSSGKGQDLDQFKEADQLAKKLINHYIYTINPVTNIGNYNKINPYDEKYSPTESDLEFYRSISK